MGMRSMVCSTAGPWPSTIRHANIAITDERYVHLQETERGRLLCQVSNNQIRQPDDELHALLAKLDKQDLHRAITIAAGLLVER